MARCSPWAPIRVTEPGRHGRIVPPRDYEPVWWLPDGHTQTLWAALAERPPAPVVTRERFELDDGDFVDLAHVGEPGKPCVVVLHGLEGSLGSPHIRRVLSAIAERGWHGVLMHFRGCSGEFNRLARNYHSGDTGDLRALLAALGERHPGISLAAVGYSMGGNVLLKYLGESAGQTALATAVAVSVPFELGRAAARLNQGFSRVYQRHLIGSLQRKAAAKEKAVPCPIDLSEVRNWNDFRTYDDYYTAPLHGFRDADDYYTRASSRQFLRGIAVPCLVLHASDDPFLPASGIPQAHELGWPVTLELAARGGHVGFIAKAPPGARWAWLEHRMVNFLSEVLDADHRPPPRG